MIQHSILCPARSRLNIVSIVAIAGFFGSISGFAMRGEAGDFPAERIWSDDEIHAGPPSSIYTPNREPLAGSPLIKLPIGSIVPRGWLRDQLELEAQGLTGRLMEVSPWLRFDKNAWTDPEGQGHSGWEELPYWLKGYGDLGYVLKDETIIKEARRWIEAALASQRDEGWFGPRSLLTSIDGKPDLWPNMLMLNVLQSYYEHSADPRVLPFMTKYFHWEMAYPEKDFLAGYWPKIRGGDNLECVYWLYNRTGDAWLLELAEKIHRCTSDWTGGVANWHGVNISQGFREPGVYYLQAKDSKFLSAAERNYRAVMDLYGQVPGGGFAADENCRPGFSDPRQGFETCSMVEFMHSFEMLTKIAGDPKWAERCEDVAFNSLPAAQTPDLKALHYLTSPNMVQLDKRNKSPGIENSGTMISYSPFEVYRCCQHNVASGWPYYAEELWLASGDGGLCASLYAASEVTAKVKDGSNVKPVKIVEETDYPFSDTIRFKCSLGEPARFPLYLRIPGWCGGAKLWINSEKKEISAKPLSYVGIDRTWNDGDIVRLQLPMTIALRKWTKNHDSVSVDYGPLTFSLAIGERWSRYGGTDKWPEQEVFPTTPWNYGLVLDDKDPATSFEVVRGTGPLAKQPFTADTAPIRLKAKARRIPEWRQDSNGLLRPLQASPVQSKEPLETVALIPMGAARLRIAAFPTIGDGADAHVWNLPTKPPTASHCFERDTTEALNDGILPSKSNDTSIPRFTWWDHRGTREWVQYDFDEPRSLKSSDVYWFDDTGSGNCRVPKSWRLLYKHGNDWKPVPGRGPYGIDRDKFNHIQFEPIKTISLRLEAELQPDFSAGILEWKIE
jgi:Beta-L-arabinofuranosidase, GH127